MFTNKFQKRLAALFMSVTLCISASTPGAFAQMSKTPKTGADAVLMEPAVDFKMPDNYPEDINKYFEEFSFPRSFVVIDDETNRVIAQRDANTPYPIASMSKVISTYMAYKAIYEGKITMDTMVKIPQEIEDGISSDPDLSNVGLIGGQEYSVKDLIHGIMLQSGNDATSALMWEIYGNEELAVQAIKDQLAEWGITNIQFYQTSGAPNQYLPEEMWIPGSSELSENYMSATDVALMAQHLVDDYPEVLEVTSTPEYTFAAGTDQEKLLINPNDLLPGRPYGRENVKGLKSGFTQAAGKNFVATSTENGRKIIVVVMGLFDETSNVYWEIATLLDKLNETPDLYKNDKLPIAKHPSESELAAIAEKEAEAKKKAEQSKAANPKKQNLENTYPNKRDNMITNIFNSLFGVFS